MAILGVKLLSDKKRGVQGTATYLMYSLYSSWYIRQKALSGFYGSLV